MIIYKTSLTEEMKSVVREKVVGFHDDEFLILFDDDQAIFGEKKSDKVVVREVISYF